ncbi:hypothetical protein BGW38_007338, partial [Lunasporangiospora selenospora]
AVDQTFYQSMTQEQFEQYVQYHQQAAAAQQQQQQSYQQHHPPSSRDGSAGYSVSESTPRQN